MDETNSLIEQRKAKLASLRAKGIDPFKNKFAPAETCVAARANYVEGREVALAGRITAHRDMGKSMFLDIRDQSGRIQLYAQKNVLGDEQFDIFRHLDLADFIGVKGTMFTTKTGEISVKLTSFVILTKALRPPPAKWHGLEDTEIRYRQRYLDLMGNPEVKDVFLKRSAIVHEIRQFFHGRGYVEVETPAMQAIPGGAAAQPFTTFHNALGCEFYLRIALELYHKRLLVGGIDKLFEIGKNFRNEGLSRRHNPEFTMLEAYQAFGDYESMMETVQSLICHVAQKVLGTLQIDHNRDTETKIILHNARVFLKSDCHFLFDTFTGDKNFRDVTELISPSATKLEQLLGEFGIKTSIQLAKEAKQILQEFYQRLTDAVMNPAVAIHRDSQELGQIRNGILGFVTTLEQLEMPKIIDLTPKADGKWETRKYKDLIREMVQKKTNRAVSDWFALTQEKRRVVAIRDLGLAGDIGKGFEDFEVTGKVFEKLVEPTLIQPTFVTHLPKELVPLAKLTNVKPSEPDYEDLKDTVEVFECCINGQEISPGYTEQNDPIAQRTTLEHQAGGEQQKLDEDFLVALEHGMPPAGGIGIGIDRLCMMLLGQESIRDVILFPQLKPK
jgi:lysyl-tRNA synthetase class 2